MNIELDIGESVEITLKDTDGKFTVIYGDQAVSIEADMPDTDGRVGMIYSERYAESSAAMDASDPTTPFPGMSAAELELEANQGGPAPGFPEPTDYGYGTPEKPMSNQKRMELELSLVRLLVEDAVKAGFMVTVYDGEEHTLDDSTDVEAIMGALRTTDMDSLLLKKLVATDSFLMGAIHLIYGNAPWEVVSDNSPCGEEICKMRYKDTADAMQREWS